MAIQAPEHTVIGSEHGRWCLVQLADCAVECRNKVFSDGLSHCLDWLPRSVLPWYNWAKHVLLDKVKVLPDVGKLIVERWAVRVAAIEYACRSGLRTCIVEQGKCIHASLTTSCCAVEVYRWSAGRVVRAGHASRWLTGNGVISLPDAWNPAIIKKVSDRTVEIGSKGNILKFCDGWRVRDIECSGISIGRKSCRKWLIATVD